MYLQVLALDLDGTLAQNDQVAPETWAALSEAKAAGIALLLVTGRRLEALEGIGPFEDFFEAIVAENGGLIFLPKSKIILHPFGTLPSQLLTDLAQLSIPLEVGKVIAATWVPHDKKVADLLVTQQYSATLEYNKGAVMILPPGATKGTGLLVALRELGYSNHNVIACGDGENDLSFFEQAEVGVAVNNATPELKAISDIVLSASNGKGVQSLIHDLLNEQLPISGCNRLHQLTIGKTQEAVPFCINPLSLTKENLVIAGSSGSGKSWLSGLIAEKLLEREYQLCLIDPEGDYAGIRAFPHTLLLGGENDQPPSVEQVTTLIEYTDLSLILDLSLYTMQEKTTYLESLLRGLKSLRSRRGKPHWILIDEAHYFFSEENTSLNTLLADEMQEGGIGIISYRPSQLAPAILNAVHNWIFTRFAELEELSFLSSTVNNICTPETLQQVSALPRGKALVCFHADAPTVNSPTLIEYKISKRTTPHIRHLHKYLRASLPSEKQFYFHITEVYDGPETAGSLWEFLEAMHKLPTRTLEYHLGNSHFEQWLSKVLHDKELAQQMRKIARRKLKGESLRKDLISVTRKRYDQLEKLV